MPRLPRRLVQEVNLEIKAGTSLNTLSQDYSLNKSTLYYYYKKIKGKKYVQPYVQPNFTEQEGEIVGIFAGDGSQYLDKKGCHYQVNVHFGGHNTEYAYYVRRLFYDFFKKEFRLSRSGVGTLRLRIDSKAIFEFFKNYIEYDSKIKHCTVRLKDIKMPLKFKIGFIRGLVDTDGSILYDNHDRAIRIFFYTTSKHLIEQIGLILRELNVDYGYFQRLDKRGFKPMHIIRLKKCHVDKFLKIVKPYKQKLLGGPVVQW